MLFVQLFAPPPPAFLDSRSTITVWLQNPATAEEARSRITVVRGKAVVKVKSVEARERAKQAPSKSFVNLPGTFQSALGGSDWDPSDRSTEMVPVGGDRYELIAVLPKGRYEYKLAMGGNWDKNFGVDFVPGGANLAIEVPTATLVRFIADFRAKTLRNSLQHPTEVPRPTVAPAPYKPSGLAQSFTLELERPLDPDDLGKGLTIRVGRERDRTVVARGVLDGIEWTYTGNDLGAQVQGNRTAFRVWSPPSDKVNLIVRQDGRELRVPMSRGPKGTWATSVDRNLTGALYQYEFANDRDVTRAADIYGTAATADSKWSALIDLSKTNPSGWDTTKFQSLKSQTDAVLYEVHVRDFTSSPTSGVRPEWRGKYLGMVEPGTQPGTIPTGLSYLKWLGVTHVHLLPIQNFNPDHSTNYNWGYETTLFNVPEEQYSTRASDPTVTIRDTKRMIQGLHENGLGVVLDVVYNHSVPSEGPKSAFWAAAPYFYFRTNDRGDVLNESGVGNALHDERPMVLKFIRDSLTFWTREYKIDGYRFDLLGMFTRNTVADLAQAIRRVNPNAVIYGEPWTGGGPNRFPKGSQKGLRVAVFNDDFRGVVRGDTNGNVGGAMMGLVGRESDLSDVLQGSIDRFAISPEETVNYVSAHDDLSLRDKVERLIKGPEQDRSVELGLAMVILSQGIPFLEGGSEIGRTKGGIANSYNAGDSVNQFNWKRAEQFWPMASRVRDLIALRRAHPALRLSQATQIRRLSKRMNDLAAGLVGLDLDGAGAGDSWKRIAVVFNTSREAKNLSMPGWRLVAGAPGSSERLLPGLGYAVFRRD
jgi:pullulanase